MISITKNPTTEDRKSYSSGIAQGTYRITSIDLLRGLVMIIMALDHTRDMFHAAAFTDDPLNLQTTTPILFFTRWITHFCAPVFVFLAGTSIYLQSLRKTKNQLSIFLIKRGLWLILIEIFVMSLAFTFDPTYSSIIFQTIWAIGISMVLLGLAIRMPYRLILITGLIIVLGHNALDFYEADQKSFPFIYDLIHHPGFYHLWGNHNLDVFYPFLPWTGLMLLGYCFGKIFTKYEGKQRRKLLIQLGLGIILFFIALRATNVYGDPRDWANQQTSLLTLFSFVNTTKYPPSLLYMCMTIGPALLFLAAADKIKNRLAGIITVYGRVPFLYYILHFYLLHFLAMILFLARGHSFAEGWKPNPQFPFKFIVPGEGYSLAVVYIVWILVVAALYPVCKWFSNYKINHKKWWLSYL
ncbi:MAG: heparan-alpha-glucosaminide N-acetyltransferase domain-containing protein [Segetibacter sp.]